MEILLGGQESLIKVPQDHTPSDSSEEGLFLASSRVWGLLAICGVPWLMGTSPQQPSHHHVPLPSVCLPMCVLVSVRHQSSALEPTPLQDDCN